MYDHISYYTLIGLFQLILVTSDQNYAVIYKTASSAVVYICSCADMIFIYNKMSKQRHS